MALPKNVSIKDDSAGGIPGFIMPKGYVLCRKLKFIERSAGSGIQLVTLGKEKPVAFYWLVVQGGGHFDLDGVREQTVLPGDILVTSTYSGNPIEFKGALYFRIAVADLVGMFQKKDADEFYNICAFFGSEDK